MTSMGIDRGCNCSVEHLVQIECDALPIANGIHHHQRLTHTKLHDIACRENVRVAETSKLVNLNRAALGLELVRQPTKRRRCPTAMITLSTAKRSALASRSMTIGEA